jgi:hypothetical protein
MLLCNKNAWRLCGDQSIRVADESIGGYFAAPEQLAIISAIAAGQQFTAGNSGTKN